MTDAGMESDSKSPPKSPSDNLEPLDLVLSCAYCQAFLKDLYSDRQGLNDEQENDGIFGAGPVRMWILSCGHPICSEHLEGGGAPFHPHGEVPKGVCPYCEVKHNDKRTRTLYWIRGFGENEHDPRVSQKYFTYPPLSSHGSHAESEALMFQLTNLVRFGLVALDDIGEYKEHLESLQHDLQDTDQQKTRLEEENHRLQSENHEYRTKQEAFKKRRDEITHYLSKFAELAGENAELRRRLKALDQPVPPPIRVHERDQSEVQGTRAPQTQHDNAMEDTRDGAFNPFAATDLNKVLEMSRQRERVQLNHHHTQITASTGLHEPVAGRSAFEIPSPFDQDVTFKIRGGKRNSTRGEQLWTSHQDRTQHDRPLDISKATRQDNYMTKSSSPFKRNPSPLKKIRSPVKNGDVFNPYRSPTSTISPKKQRRDIPPGSSQYFPLSIHHRKSTSTLPNHNISSNTRSSPLRHSNGHHNAGHPHHSQSPDEMRSEELYRTPGGLFARRPPTTSTQDEMIIGNTLLPRTSLPSLNRDTRTQQRRGVPEAGVRAFLGAKTSRAG